MKPLQYQLENGLKVILLPTCAAPAFACEVWFGAGSAQETPQQNGIARLIPRILFAPELPNGRNKLFTELTENGGEGNAFTTLDASYYQITQTSRELERTLELLSDVICHPFLTDGERTLAGYMKNEKVVELSPKQKAFELLRSHMFHVLPYYERHRDILPSDDLSMVFEQVLSFYYTHYVPSNATIILVGDFEIGAVKLLIKRCFGDWKGPVYQPIPLPEEPKQEKIKTHVESYDGLRSILYAGFHAPEVCHEDILPLQLLSLYLSDASSGFLFKDPLPCVQDLTTSCETWKTASLFGLSAEYQRVMTEEEEPVTLEDALYSIFKKLFEVRGRKISEKSMRRCRVLLKTQKTTAKETLEGLATAIGQNAILKGDINEEFFDQLLQRITSEDLRRIAWKYFTPQNCTAILLNPNDAEPISPGAVARIIQEAYTAQEMEERQSSEQVFFSLHGEPGDVLSCQLANGLRLIVQEDHSVERFAIHAGTRVGILNESINTCGETTFAARLITQGTKNLNQQDIHRFFSSRGSSIYGIPDYYTFSLSSSGLSSFFSDCFEVFADCWMNSTVPQDAFRHTQKEMLHALRSAQGDPQTLTLHTLQKECFGQHPFSFPKHGTPELAEHFDSDTIRLAIKRLTRCNGMVLTVVGDVNADLVAEHAAELFSRYDHPYSPDPIPTPPPRTAPRLINLHANTDKAHIAIAFEAAPLADPLCYVEDVINHSLFGRDGFLFPQLYRKYRVEDGRVTLLRGFETSAVIVTLVTIPDEVESVLRGFYHIIESFRCRPKQQEFFDIAKKQLLGAYDVHLQTMQARAKAFFNKELLYGSWEESLRYKDHIDKVSTEDEGLCLERFLNINSSLIVVTTPPLIQIKPDLLGSILE